MCFLFIQKWLERKKEMGELSKKVEELEKERDRLYSLKDKYRTMSILLCSAMRNEWVKEMVVNSKIVFNFRTYLSKEEVQKYIARLESVDETNKRIK